MFKKLKTQNPMKILDMPRIFKSIFKKKKTHKLKKTQNPNNPTAFLCLLFLES